MKFYRLMVISAFLLVSKFALASYGSEAVKNWAANYQKQHGASSLHYEYDRYQQDPQIGLINALNRAWQRGVIAAKQGKEINEDDVYESSLTQIQRLPISNLISNDATLSLVNVYVQALRDGWAYGHQSLNTTPAPGSDRNSSIAASYSCQVDVSYKGKRSRYMKQNEPWDQVITDSGSYFSWDLPRGNRGNSTGQDAFSDLDDKAPDMSKKLLRKSTESDGSVVDEVKVDVQYDQNEAPHKFVYARRVKPNGIREYYVTDLTDKRAFMFTGCK